MLYFNGIDVSERIDINKTIALKNVMFLTIGNFRSGV